MPKFVPGGPVLLILAQRIIDTLTSCPDDVEIVGAKVKPTDTWTDSDGAFHWLTVTLRLKEYHPTSKLGEPLVYAERREND